MHKEHETTQLVFMGVSTVPSPKGSEVSAAVLEVVHVAVS